MSKRILLAEASEAIRGVAEPVLRQNGFEVIAVPSAERACGVLELSQPDLIVAGADLTLPGGRPLYEKLQADARTRSIPLLVIAQPEASPESLPGESLITLPLQPKAFLQKVSSMADAARRTSASVSHAQQQDREVDDVVDAALGLDHIEITESEVMDQTTQVRLTNDRKNRRKPDLGEGIEDQTDDDLMRTGRVEIVNIDDDNTDIVAPKHKQRAPQDPSASGKLEILSDANQYAMESPEDMHADSRSHDHDYEWLVKELQNEATTQESPQPTPEPGKKVSRQQRQSTSQELENTANYQDGVAEFIDEFRKEVEKIHRDEADRVILEKPETSEPAPPRTASSTQERRSWEDTLDRITPEQVDLFCSRFTRELADRVAERIAARIDPDKLLRLIRDEVLAEAGRARKK